MVHIKKKILRKKKKGSLVRTPRDHEGRDWIYAAANQGIPKIASKLPEARKRKGRIPLQVSEGAWLCQHFYLGLLASELWHKKILYR